MPNKTLITENDQFQYNEPVIFRGNAGFGYPSAISDEIPSALISLPLVIYGSEGFGVPSGTTEQRPSVTIPTFRYNSTIADMEYYNPSLSGWLSVRNDAELSDIILNISTISGDLITLSGSSGGNSSLMETVSALPVSASSYATIFYLTQTEDFYPIGYYRYNQTGWVCIEQLSPISLVQSGGVLSGLLVAGATYDLKVTGNISDVELDLQTYGSCNIISENFDAYSIDDPIGGFKRTAAGLDQLSSEHSEIIITKNSGGLIYSAVELISLSLLTEPEYSPFITVWQTTEPNQTIGYKGPVGATGYSGTISVYDNTTNELLSTNEYTGPEDDVLWPVMANPGTYRIEILGSFPFIQADINLDDGGWA